MIGPDRVKNYLLAKIVDPVFYPDISQARRVSEQILGAAWKRETGITIAVEQRWRRQTIKQEMRFNISNPAWYVNLAQSINSYVATRDRAAIQRAMDLLSRQGAILN